MVQLLQETGCAEEAGTLRLQHFLPWQAAFLGRIDDLEAVSKSSSEGTRCNEQTARRLLRRATSRKQLARAVRSIRRMGIPHDSAGFDNNGESLLGILADDLDRVMLLCLRGNGTIRRPPERTRLALNALLRDAPVLSQAACVETLLEAGADLEADHDAMQSWLHLGTDFESMTAHIAAKLGHREVVGLLISRGANISRRKHPAVKHR
ncbi:hypothetical protein BDW62DRAFT_135906 [Aspergillus aurantiobrunneus]